MFLDEASISWLAVAHFVVASAVTVHVLVGRRDVRSSIAWIGLTWLSPFLGSTIYIAFGINRVRRLARAGRMQTLISGGVEPDVLATGLPANTSEGIVSLERTGRYLADQAIAPGNSAVLLTNGTEAFPRMIAAINGAQRVVALTSYIFADDAVGGSFVDALIAAHRRGVAVRVMLDGIGGGYFRSPIVERLRDGGVPVARFFHEWLPWKMSFINLRNHKKLLIVDSQIGFTGGMNISAENSEAEGPLKVRDVQTEVAGPVVAHLLKSFMQDWEFVTGEELSGPLWAPDLSEKGGYLMRGVSAGPDESLGAIKTLFAAAIEQATQSVRIVTPYFLPDDSLLQTLRRAALRGLDVDIILPSRSNHFFFDWAVMANLRGVDLERIRIYQTDEPFDHSKLFTIDGSWATLGSPNWDERSLRLNFEFVLETYSPAFVQQIDTLIDQKVEGAVRMTATDLADLSFIVRVRDGAMRLLLPYL